MHSTLDKFGRVVIPKPVRDDLQLTPGTVLEIEEQEGKIVLGPVWEKPPLIRKSGILVFAGKATDDLVHAVDRDRRGRLARAAYAAEKARVDRLVTFNPGDFRRVWPGDEEAITVP